MSGAVQGGSPYEQARVTASQPFYSTGLFAVSGKRTDEIASQIPSAYTAGATMVAIDGGVNDIVQSVAEATLRTNLIANWATIRSYGMEPIDIGLPPTNTAGNVPRYIANEVWRKLYCLKNRIRHADIYSVLAQATGAYKTGYFTDAIHYNSVGAIAAAAPLLSAIQTNVNRDKPLLAMTDTASDAGTWISNAVSFAGGATPTGWFSTGTGGTLSVNTADANDLGSWFRCTCAAAAAGGMTATAVTLASLGWAIGDKLAVGFRVRWTDASQALAISSYVTGVTVDVQPMFSETGGATGSSQYVYKECTITAGTVINFSVFATGTGFFEINRPIVVNLTKLGLA
jgi:hypothetical protein